MLCLLVAATIDKGGFFEPMSAIVFAACLVTAAIGWLVRPDLRAVDIAMLGFAAWWWVTSVLHAVPGHFLPLGASVLGVLAASVAVRAVARPWRVNAGRAVAAIAAATGAVGIVACGLRWYPEAIRAQDLWRLAGPLTYSNGAGALLAVGGLLCVGTWRRSWPAALALAGCVAGLIATQSRGAALAMLIGCAWCSWSELADAAPAAACGAASGLVVVASSQGPSRHVLALVASLALIVAAPVAERALRRDTPRADVRRPAKWLAAGAGAVTVALVVLARTEVVRRVDLGSDVGRLRAWRAALSQFSSSPWDGAGADRILHTSPGGAGVFFAHNEYLQVLAGSGLLGAALLVGVFGAGVLALRAASPRSRAAIGATVAFCVSGVFDFTWHIPAIALAAGVALGIGEGDAAAGAADTLSPSR